MRSHFPSDEAVAWLIFLALKNITADWGRASLDWKQAMNNSPFSLKTVSG
jgi:putative transposase